MSETTIKPEAKNDFLSRPLFATINLDWEKAIYLVFILIAIVTRFYDLGSRVMSHDESLHTQFSYQYFIGDGYKHTALMHGPSLFHATALAYWLFGDSDTSARVPVAILGVLLILWPYLLRGWIGRVGALFASFFLLISPYITYYSRYIRHDIYVITCAVIVFIAMWYYLRQPKEKYLWWFVGAMALMFSTMETAYIYVAIFGSFLVVRLFSRIWGARWAIEALPRLRLPMLVTIVTLLVMAGTLLVYLLQEHGVTTADTPSTADIFAADPEQSLVTEEGDETALRVLLGWVAVGSIFAFSLALLYAIGQLRPYIDNYPEFDLVFLCITLLLPLISPIFTRLIGQNPMEYNIIPCTLAGQENMTALQLFLSRLGQAECWRPLFTTGVIYSIGFLLITILIAVLVGLWWHQRRWTIAVVIFYSIFTVLFTSVFTNPEGWASGAIGSLGYWLEQQGVARGNQPPFYYFFVTPFYEFLALIFALLGIRHWLRQERISQVVGYWLSLLLLALLTYSLVNWRYNLPLLAAGQSPSRLPSLIVAIVLLAVGVAYWFVVRRKQLLQQYELTKLAELSNRDALFAFIPSLIWWLLLSWVAYSYAGEKMPWLSTHFMFPMVLLGGWYMHSKLSAVSWHELFSTNNLRLLGLTVLLALVTFLAISPILAGTIEIGNQAAGSLTVIGRFLGSLLVVGIIFYLWLRQANIELSDQMLIKIGAIILLVASLIFAQESSTLQIVIRWLLRAIAVGAFLYAWQQQPEEKEPRFNINAILTTFILLSLLTIRFTYMANFVNADYTTEYMVYAHGAPATKSTVLAQIEQLSMRLHGDKSIRVAYDNDVSWPYTWYLRDYPNRLYFGATPGTNITEAPVLVVGRASWDKVEPFLGNNYESRTYTFLWWPMEEYRKINSWNAIFGDPLRLPDDRRGLGNSNVRQALWNIFFYRDYTKYGEVFGGSYNTGQWTLRHDLRLYIRKDVLVNLWDYGLGAGAIIEDLRDPYEENELTLEPALVVGNVAGVENGQFVLPRNVAVAADGRIFVADSGNHRIQVFDQTGAFVTSWGSFGAGPGQFNEPWGIAVDETAVYVADTWNHRIQKFTLDGEWLNAFGSSGSPSESDSSVGLFFGPRALTLLPDNLLLVTDTGNHRMQLLDRDGQFLTQIGSPGAALGFLNEPVGIAVGPDGSVYVADTWNGRIQKFSSDLIIQTEWRVNAWGGQSIVNKPYIAVDSQNRVYVSDPEGYRVIIFDSEGNYLARFGRFGTDLSSLGLPNGLAIDAQDNLYIADANNNRILKFAPIFGAAEGPAPETDEQTLPDNGAAEEQDGLEEEEGLGEESVVEPTATE